VLALWSAVSGVIQRVGTDALPGLSGLWRPLRLTGIAFLLGGLALSGVPPLPGFWSQRLLLVSLLNERRWMLAFAVLLADALLALTTVGVFQRAFLRKEQPPALSPRRRWLNAQLLFAAAALLLAAVLAGPFHGWSRAVATGVLSLSP
jgi:NADH:ubiquinone oxidoreductase subunit 5 (subunit L)/multisubunit Na+/H+ antiporter MnhA subunit